jgi:phage protein D
MATISPRLHGSSGRVAARSYWGIVGFGVLGELYDSPGASRSAAKSLREDKNRNATQLSLSLTRLRTGIGAGQPLSVSGLRSEIDGSWVVTEAAHQVGVGTARTTLAAQRQVA